MVEVGISISSSSSGSGSGESIIYLVLLLEFFDSTAANDIQSQQPIGHGGEFQTAVHKELRSLERDV